VLLALAILVFFIAGQSRLLWCEWHRLRRDLSLVRQTTVIGYQNISPNVSFAQRPKHWFRHEGEFTYLWGGWDDHSGHHWFRIERGDLDVDSDALSLPIGRDVFQAIDAPIIEAQGGAIWGRIPAEALVAVLEMAGIESVYPILLLDKVQVVNDVIDRRPLLVTYNPMADQAQAVEVYEAVVDGRRVTMGSSGYLQGKEPVLYDRGSESLWIGAGDALRAIAGPQKGRTLRQVARPALVTWGRWRDQHPRSRLLVGAIRSASKVERSRVEAPMEDAVAPGAQGR